MFSDSLEKCEKNCEQVKNKSIIHGENERSWFTEYFNISFIKSESYRSH